MSIPFEQHFRVSWSDLDGNGHMANTAYLERAVDTRFLFFAERGFPVSRLVDEHIGPVVQREELVYRKELRLLQDFTVDLQLAGLSPDGVRFRVNHAFRNSSRELVATVSSAGLWFDLEQRRRCAPPPDLDTVQRQAPRADLFSDLPPWSPEPSNEVKRPT